MEALNRFLLNKIIWVSTVEGRCVRSHRERSAKGEGVRHMHWRKGSRFSFFFDNKEVERSIELGGGGGGGKRKVDIVELKKPPGRGKGSCFFFHF